jgi:hypothetical protein
MAIRLISSNAPSTTPDFPEESPASGDRLDEFKGVALLIEKLLRIFPSNAREVA